MSFPALAIAVDALAAACAQSGRKPEDFDQLQTFVVPPSAWEDRSSRAVLAGDPCSSKSVIAWMPPA